MRVRFESVRISSGYATQEIVLVNYVTLSDGSKLYIVAGFWNDAPTEERVQSGQPPFQYHVTHFQPMMCTKLPPREEKAKCVAAGDLFVDERTSYRKFVNMALRMRYTDACNFSHPGCASQPHRIYWEFVFDRDGESYYEGLGVGGLWDWIIGGSWTNPRNPYPVTAEVGYHGVYSKDTSAGNQLHIHTEDHSYYFCCQLQGKVYPQYENISNCISVVTDCTPCGACFKLKFPSDDPPGVPDFDLLEVSPRRAAIPQNAAPWNEEANCRASQQKSMTVLWGPGDQEVLAFADHSDAEPWEVEHYTATCTNENGDVGCFSDKGVDYAWVRLDGWQYEEDCPLGE